ncbi:unnamed protein product [Rangifer tarandus platyrhynchus]|uniref:Uncharacterized protein n=1 Tax=Rangifer tarandus platyrhynchus TaxID=3082113 RepID=A0AC59ZS77_RANTA
MALSALGLPDPAGLRDAESLSKDIWVAFYGSSGRSGALYNPAARGAATAETASAPPAQASRLRLSAFAAGRHRNQGDPGAAVGREGGRGGAARRSGGWGTFLRVRVRARLGKRGRGSRPEGVGLPCRESACAHFLSVLPAAWRA